MPTAFERAILRFANVGSDDMAMDEVIRAAPSATDEELAELALILARSGKVIARIGESCDLASTGGPSSLSTLVCPLLLRTAGFTVPKIGVPGRPAGAIDVMGTVPGYCVSMGSDEFTRRLRDSGFAHALADGDMAPLDGRLFHRRKTVGAVDVPSLAISSLLSKKVAAGLDSVVLDVRVWRRGNFGHSFAEARENAVRFCRVAALLDIDASCALGDLDAGPFQPYLGRGESLLALHDLLLDEPSDWLSSHFKDCIVMAQASGRSCSAELIGREFESHLESQGSSLGAFRMRVAEIRTHPTALLHAMKPGILHVDIEAVRNVLVGEQRRLGRMSDPCGVTLLLEAGSRVVSGEPVAKVRHCDGTVLPRLVADIESAVGVGQQRRARRHLELVSG